MEPEQVVEVESTESEAIEKPRKEKRARKPPTEAQLAALAKGRELRKNKFVVVPKEELKPVQEEEPVQVPPKPVRVVKPQRVRKEKIVYYEADSDSENEYHAPPTPKYAPAKRAPRESVVHPQQPAFNLMFV